jgi:17beta-estradiol 17-dehydrogenase / very-long-chain 3-oxoacyl-CoA reductase
MILLLNQRYSLFEYLGIVVFGYVALKLVYKILNNLGTFVLGLGSVNLKSYGSWGIVTGCTDGIGKAYAEKLAKRGLNIVLISRSLDKLQEQAKHLKEKYSVETKVIAADFTGETRIFSFYYDRTKLFSSISISRDFTRTGEYLS